MSKLYASVTKTTNPLNISVSMSHASVTTVATINCVDTTLGLNDPITIDLGYYDNHDVIFTGYVKELKQTVKEGWTITAHDAMIRASDYFIVSDTPDTNIKYRGITAEALVGNVLGLAGITSYDGHVTSFTFGINSDVEINLVSAADYCGMIAGLLTWHIYCDTDGTVHFINRKPYPVVSGAPELLQPGMSVDTSIGTWGIGDILDASIATSDKDLRNRVVVYGKLGTEATSQATSSHLPAGFYKAAVVASEILDSYDEAKKTADYNLLLFNRLIKLANVNFVGDTNIIPRNCIVLDATRIHPDFDGSTLWYIFSAQHSWSREGYTISCELRKYEATG